MKKAKKEVTEIKEEKEVTPSVDLSSIKEELSEYVDKEIRASFNTEVKRLNNKLIREKNRKIAFRNMIILVLLVFIGFLLYLLNSVDYFDKFFINEDTPIVSNDPKKEEKEEIEVIEDVGPTLEELKSEFSYLLNNISIDETSIYINDYYNGKLSDELRNYLAFNTLEFNNLTIEDDCNVIDSALFKEVYSKMFNNEIVYTGFDYNGNKVKYLSKLDSFITTSVLEKFDSKITREIIDIKVDGNDITITTVEGILNNDRLYNIITKEEVRKYKKDSLINYQDKLNTVVYSFKDSLLVNIGK